MTLLRKKFEKDPSTPQRTFFVRLSGIRENKFSSTRIRTFFERLVTLPEKIFEEEITLPDNGQFLSRIQRGHKKKFSLHPTTDNFEAKNKCRPEIFFATRQRTFFLQMVPLDRGKFVPVKLPHPTTDLCSGFLPYALEFSRKFAV